MALNSYVVSEKMENGPELYSRKKVRVELFPLLSFFDVSRAFFSTRYSQLVFTILTVE
jgi:hypothetical protein